LSDTYNKKVNKPIERCKHYVGGGITSCSGSAPPLGRVLTGEPAHEYLIQAGYTTTGGYSGARTTGEMILQETMSRGGCSSSTMPYLYHTEMEEGPPRYAEHIYESPTSAKRDSRQGGGCAAELEMGGCPGGGYLVDIRSEKSRDGNIEYFDIDSRKRTQNDLYEHPL